MSAGGKDRQRNTSGSAGGEPDSPDSHRKPHTQNGNADDVEPGMAVETREGDLGESDVSTARVKDVERDVAGDVTNVVVEKGVVFRKTLEVPPSESRPLRTLIPQPSPRRHPTAPRRMPQLARA